ncbi:MAG: hypothetical protein U0640_13195 [Phycisphaerales bacterium]
MSFASIATAQNSGSQDSTAKTTKEETQSESNNERPVSTFEDTQVRIEVDQFGVSDVARLGEWIGVKIRIQDMGTEQRTVLVRLSTTDADGDQPQQQREVTTNPGVKQDVWMYMRLPFAGIDRVPVTISVYDAVETGATAPVERVYRPGRLLGKLEMPPTFRPQESTIGLMAVVGDRPLGLKQYSNRPDNGAPFSKYGHELIQVITGLKPNTMPDRWMGLAQFDTIVWASGEITELRSDRALALSQWVQRGGHLIIVLPPVGQQWLNPQSNDIYNIMPAVTVNRRENTDMLPYRPMITSRVDAIYPATGVVHTFSPLPNAEPSQAMRILNGPDGTCVVVRRLVGIGAVTMIGLDLNATRFSQSDTIEADVFWHRILGKRGELLYEKPPKINMGLGADRRSWYVDGPIAKEIAYTGKSALGALVGFIVFGLYWILVGPGVYFVLKRRDQHKHAWLAFIAGSAVFTVFAWGAATFLRPLSVQARHFTILDHVYGQPTQRARTWTSILIPSYGEARVVVGDNNADEPTSLNAMAPWENPGEDLSRIGSFPDVRGYPIDTRTPDAATFPVRATIKTLQVDWAGAPTWKMIAPDMIDGQPSQVQLNDKWDPAAPAGTEPMLYGSISHGFPQPLESCRIYIVRYQNEIKGVGPGTLPVANVYEFRPFDKPDRWNPNDSLNLAVATKVSRPDLLVKRLDSLVPWSGGVVDVTSSPGSSMSLESQLDALTLFDQLPFPDWISMSNNSGLSGVTAAQRRFTHGLDLCRWFTQPCIIVTGYVGNANRDDACPVPMSVNNDKINPMGRTFVRWVFPLATRPPNVVKVEDQVGRKRPKSESDPE